MTKFASVFLVSDDGTNRLHFDESLPFLDLSGTGMPSIEHVIETPVSGIGSKVYRVLPRERELVLSLYMPVKASQELYMAKRAELIRMFTPRLNSVPVVWVFVALLDGTMYKLPVLYESGLEFDEGNISHGGETFDIKLKTTELLWHGAEVIEIAGIETTSVSTWKFPLVIPAGRGIVWAGAGTRYKYTADYQGTYPAKPLIHLYGSFNVAFIEHIPTNTLIHFTQAINSFEERILDLNSPSGRYIAYDQNGNDVTHELAYYSDMGLSIYPDEYFDEDQYILVTFSGGTSDDTRAEITYTPKYIGI